MVFTHSRKAIGIFSDYDSAEVALKDLENSGFPMNKISVIGRDVNNYRWHADFKVRDRLDEIRSSFAPDQVNFYDDRLSRGHYLVEVEGSEEDIDRAERVLSHRGIQNWTTADQSGRYSSHPSVHSTSGSYAPLRNRGTLRRAVGVFSHRRDVESALHEVQDSGFPMQRVSVIKQDNDGRNDRLGTVGQDRDEGNKADEGAAAGAVSGGILGGLTGLLVGLGTLAIPGVGPIMLAGATATTIATTLGGATVGAVAGGLIGALIGLGIPEERARVYNERVARGDYLVIVEGTDAELQRVESIFRDRHVEEYEVYDIPESKTHQTAPTTQVIDTSPTEPIHPTPIATQPSTTHTVTPTTTATSPRPRATTSGNVRSGVGLFSRLHDAELAIADLRNADFPLSQVTLVGQYFERREPFAGVILRDRFDELHLSLPEDRTRFYSDRVQQGNYAVIINGTEAEIRRAESLIHHRGIQDWAIYDFQPMEMAQNSPSSFNPTRHDESRGNVNAHPDVIIVDRRDQSSDFDKRNH
ncbi:MAG: hypothetical protein VKJ02_13295 [Snowella sp.]|nr:hypothetical protein [Snowella sp.]